MTLSVLPAIITDTVVEICDGEEYVFGTQVLTTTGYYTEAFPMGGSCDSIVHLTMIVKASPVVTIDMNNGNLISTQGDDYQWSFDGNVLAGEVNQSITPTANGLYSVVLTAFNGCSNSAEYELQNVGISIKKESELLIYPNPTLGRFTIQSSILFSYKIYNVLGVLVHSNSQKNNQVKVDLSEMERGVYFVEVVLPTNDVKVIKVIKD